ncbi:GAF sensor signal transduction histidine kinase [Cellulophaga algicola DSM 14237]|uniref:histidine kinase n=1 Tax=Cellulophaga algicola (strain DSM 14237 / IC166 / ACAM 630) TaxID=688270 RepID=E6XC02_CELAD|nr:ATP-binding protein [Cellulophaga algicola]ADV50007.1 GAF sensor signal transduction histidine kinase [Cellulophaga algicola DSM 14237]
MLAPKAHKEEERRLAALQSYTILDSLPEEDYDNLSKIASEICGTPISMISLIDDKRQWFKSSYGLDVKETEREISFCGHMINETNDVFIVQDAREDDRFFDNPLVTGDTNVVFYAGVPLMTANNLPIGSLCVIDHEPKTLNKSQIESLKALSNQVMKLIELRKNELLLQEALSNQKEKNTELERFAYIAAHDLKSPLNNISTLTDIFIDQYGSKIDSQGVDILNMIVSSSNRLKGLIEGLLDYSKSDHLLNEKTTKVSIEKVKNNINSIFSSNPHIHLTVLSELNTLTINETALDQILINLVTNAIKYSDKPEVQITIGIDDSKTHYLFYVEDNGPGIPEDKYNSIFDIFTINTPLDKFGVRGNGIGLATVKKVIEKLGGEITVKSTLGEGSKFSFTIKKQPL